MEFKLGVLCFSASKTQRPGLQPSFKSDVTVHFLILEFFSFVSHVDVEKSVSAFYNQQKSGFSSMYKARVLASTQNLFPLIFGRTNSSGLDDSEYLPGVNNPDKRDNGITGLQYQISRGMSNMEFQLESAIDSIMSDYSEARQIARDCLYKAQCFLPIFAPSYNKIFSTGSSGVI